MSKQCPNVYCPGLVGPGEEVRLVREPQNQHDRNAIQVMNIGGTQVGHLPRNVAGKLAPLMDQGLVTVEGVMHEGNREYHTNWRAHSTDIHISQGLRLFAVHVSVSRIGENRVLTVPSGR